ncbi:phage portal protein [Xanthobacter autotrophicus DSM 431]|uniref:phage portal protein n=1 Tax=Xanthobacter nonsaccharivorans TaxID=3119912 RepID=UPI003728F1F1
MLARLARMLGFPKRSLDAAAGGRRWADDRRVTSPGALQAGAATIAARAAHFAANDALGSRIVESLTSNIVGVGIKPRSLLESEPVRRRLHARFRAWTDEADADGRMDFFALQAALVRDMVVTGEGLAVFTTSPSGAPQLRRLHPEQLDRSVTRPAEGGGIVHLGVEMDRGGRVVAYHIREDAPGSPFGMPSAPIRMPASEVIHLFRPLMPGQVRGLSWFTAVLVPAKELDALADAMLVRAKVAALFAGVVMDADGSGLLQGEGSDGTVTASLEPGALVSLPPGKSVEFADVPDQGGAAGLMVSTMRLIASGAGVTYEQASGDYSHTNYSSARAGLLEHRKFIETVQHHTVAFQLLRPVWNRFARWQVLMGGLPATLYQPALAVDWLPPGWPQVDPQKEIEATVAAINAGLKSRSEAIAERGLDAEDVDRQIAADAARLAKLGVVLQPAPSTSTTKEPAQ